MEFALWTRAAVMQLIEREYGLKLPVRTVGEYLKRWGFTPQKPIQRTYEQRPEAVQTWLEQEYPEIEHRAKASVIGVVACAIYVALWFVVGAGAACACTAALVCASVSVAAMAAASRVAWKCVG
jgi:hypothetical protein